MKCKPTDFEIITQQKEGKVIIKAEKEKNKNEIMGV